MKSIAHSRFQLVAIVLTILLVSPPSLLSQLPKLAPLGKSYVRYQGIKYLTYEELKRLSLNPEPKGALKKKLEKFWHTPIISNEAYYQGAKPHRPENFRLGPYLRIFSWNIEKSFHIDELTQLLTSEDAYNKMVNTEKVALGSEEHKDMLRQRKRLLNADIILFEEMEIGIKRSKYYNSAEKMAKALKMNYAYAPQYLEVDPITLGTEELEFEDGCKSEASS